MSPRKLTEDDKQEILDQYRNSEATTSTLAKSFEVSSSTISRFLKNKLTTTEYEDLIQQKRLARTPRGDKPAEAKAKNSRKTKSTKKESTKTKTKTKTRTTDKGKAKKAKKVAVSEATIPELAVAEDLIQDVVEPAPKEPTKSRRRRRSTARTTETQPEAAALEIVATSEEEPEKLAVEFPEAAPTAKLVLDDIKSKSESQTVPKSEQLILKSDKPESFTSLSLESEDDDDEDEDQMDITALKEMLGEDLEDINDEDDDEDEEWDDDDDLSYTAASNLGNIQILPLSQASLPRTCYLVIDRSAELIVKPLAEFADLGAIPDAETTQRTLPVFDNHRIAKRFSHRRERVIKVPDGRMLQKTSHHLQDKGITRLLIDGQIYSLSQ